MQYSPKLKTAMQEIKEVLKKHDIAGFILIHTPGFSEYLHKINPSYSCASIENGDIHFRVKSAEVGKEKAKQLANDTYNMIHHLATGMGKVAMGYLEAEKMLSEKLGGYPTDGAGFTSNETQNN